MARRTRTGDPKVAIAYLRVSTDRQELGPEAQRAAIEAWASREGVTVVAWYVDQGVSGGAAVDKRPALLDALAALEVHGAGVLCVARRDRLARDTMAAIAIEGLAKRAGARVVSAAGEGTEGEEEDPSAFILRRIIDVFSEYERLMIKARTRAALRVKRARGEALGEVPYGFQADEHGMLVGNESERRTIAFVRERRASGRSIRAIVRELPVHGHLGRAGKPFGISQVYALSKASF